MVNSCKRKTQNATVRWPVLVEPALKSKLISKERKRKKETISIFRVLNSNIWCIFWFRSDYQNASPSFSYLFRLFSMIFPMSLFMCVVVSDQMSVWGIKVLVSMFDPNPPIYFFMYFLPPPPKRFDMGWFWVLRCAIYNLFECMSGICLHVLQHQVEMYTCKTHTHTHSHAYASNVCFSFQRMDFVLINEFDAPVKVKQ